jgi:hypothetical protein
MNTTEKKIFKVAIRPYIIYCVINTVILILATKNVGILNNDVAYGMFASWLLYTLSFMFNSMFV